MKTQLKRKLGARREGERYRGKWSFSIIHFNRNLVFLFPFATLLSDMIEAFLSHVDSEMTLAGELNWAGGFFTSVLDNQRDVFVQ
jgi:hypothetical protein